MPESQRRRSCRLPRPSRSRATRARFSRTQTLVDRMLNTGTIDFDTASDASEERFRFHGVNEPGELRQKINQVRLGEATPGASTGGL